MRYSTVFESKGLMKILFLSTEASFYRKIQSIISSDFFSVDFCNFIPKKKYDAIITNSENINYIADNLYFFDDIPVLILNLENNTNVLKEYSGNSYIIIKNLDNLQDTLKSLYNLNNYNHKIDTLKVFNGFLFYDKYLNLEKNWISIGKNKNIHETLNYIYAYYSSIFNKQIFEKIEIILLETFSNLLDQIYIYIEKQCEFYILKIKSLYVNTFILNEICDYVKIFKENGFLNVISKIKI
jgi:hypothetical protein